MSNILMRNPPRLQSAKAMHEFNTSVTQLLTKVAADIIMPRYCKLTLGEISEKSPGEIVTIADHEAEQCLSDGLSRLPLVARTIGEEAASSNPDLLDSIGQGAVWIIDPIDGTANFSRGKEPFGIIIAYAIDGITQAGWLYDPVTGRMCHAVRNGGAFVDGRQVRVRKRQLTRPVAALATQFMNERQRSEITARAATVCDIVPIPRCAAEHYPRLALGQNDIALFQRTLPWDHAAGALFLIEAGGYVARWDGAPYHFADDNIGILAAGSQELWDLAFELLFTEKRNLMAA